MRNDESPQPTPAAHDAWTVVCIGCRRIKRADRWTRDRADSVSGLSTGYCERCLKEHRAELKHRR